MKFLAILLCIIGVILDFPKYSSQKEEIVLYICKGSHLDPVDSPHGSINFKLERRNEEIRCSSTSSYDNLTIFYGDITEGQKTMTEIKGDGTMVVNNNKGLYYIRDSKDYCVLRKTKTELTVRVCRPNCTSERKNKCFQKCCPKNQILEFKNEDSATPTCQSPQKYERKHSGFESWGAIMNAEATVQDLSPLSTVLRNIFSIKHNFSYIAPLPNFNGSYHKNLHVKNFYLLNDFQVAFCRKEMWNVFNMEDKLFCVDAVHNIGKETSSSGTLVSFAILIENSTDNFYEKVMNLPEELKKAVEDFQIIYYIFCPMSLFFLMTTIIIYGLMWENQRNIHGLTIISYLLTILCDYISWVCIPLESILEEIDYPVADYVNLFFSYSTLCWLTVINFDIWITFRKVRLPTNKIVGRYLLYASFAWIVPAGIVLVGILIENMNGSQNGNVCPEPYSNVLPLNLEKFVGRIFKQFLITGIMLAFNFIFFANTIYQMWSQHKNNNIALQDSTHRKNSMVWICSKLFVVMGGVWILDTIPIMVLYYVFWNGKEHMAIEIGKDLRFFIQKLIYCEWFTEFVSVCETFVLFYIFICKDSTYTKLWDKYPSLRGILSWLWKLSRSCQSKHTSSDQELNSNFTNSRKLSISSNY